MKNYISLSLAQMELHSTVYDIMREHKQKGYCVTYKQRLALHLGAKQNNREGMHWPIARAKATTQRAAIVWGVK